MSTFPKGFSLSWISQIIWGWGQEDRQAAKLVSSSGTEELPESPNDHSSSPLVGTDRYLLVRRTLLGQAQQSTGFSTMDRVGDRYTNKVLLRQAELLHTVTL